MNKFVSTSIFLEKHFDKRVVPVRFITSLQEMGSFTIRKIVLVIPLIIQVIRALVSYRPQLVYYTIVPKGFAFFRDMLVVLVVKLFGKKLIFHLHSRGIQESISQGRFRKWLYQLVFRKTYVIILSNSLRYELKDLNPSKIFVVPNGVPEHSYEERRPSATPELLFFSNLFEAKGIYIFIETLAILHASGSGFRARIVGSEGDVSIVELQKLIDEKGLRDFLELSGPLYGEEKYQALARASIFVLPSYDEAFPLTIIEAMQASLPIVASNVGGIPDMITAENKIGLLCEPGDANAFAAAILMLIAEPNSIVSMGRRARKEYEAKYSMQIFESTLVETLKTIAKSVD